MYELYDMMLLSEGRFDVQIAVAYDNLPESLQNEFIREFGYDILNSAQQLLMDLEDYEVLGWAADWVEENSNMVWDEGILWKPYEDDHDPVQDMLRKVLVTDSGRVVFPPNVVPALASEVARAALGGPVRFAGLNQFSAPVYVRD